MKTKIYSVNFLDLDEGTSSVIELYTSKKEAVKVMLEKFKEEATSFYNKETDKENSWLIDGVSIINNKNEQSATCDLCFKFNVQEETLNTIENISFESISKTDEEKLNQEIDQLIKDIMKFNSKPVPKNKKIQKVYQVLNEVEETIDVKNTLKEAKAVVKANDEANSIVKSEFVIEEGQKTANFYGVTFQSLFLNDRMGDYLFANKKEARKLYNNELKQFKKDLKIFEDEGTPLSHTETDNKFTVGLNSYLIFNCYTIDV